MNEESGSGQREPVSYIASWRRRDGGFDEPLERLTFERIKVCRHGIITALDIEENYNGLIERFFKFQKELVDVIFSTTLRYPSDWNHLRECSQRLNRELVCLLSAARMYIDQALHLYGQIEGAQVDDLKKWFSIEYDDKFGYRVCEALRNVSQHRMLPTQSLSIGGGWREARDVREHATKLFIVVEELEKDGALKASVLTELKGRDPQVELAPLLRDYLNGLAVVNGKLRDALEIGVAIWLPELRAFLQERIDDLAFGSVEVAKLDGERREKLTVFDALLKRLELLRTRNASGPRAFDFQIVC